MDFAFLCRYDWTRLRAWSAVSVASARELRLSNRLRFAICSSATSLNIHRRRPHALSLRGPRLVDDRWSSCVPHITAVVRNSNVESCVVARRLTISHTAQLMCFLHCALARSAHCGSWLPAKAHFWLLVSLWKEVFEKHEVCPFHPVIAAS
jgi:small-conductance mechanosensitive channel